VAWCSHGRAAGDASSLAPCGLELVLATEVPTRSTTDSHGAAHSDSSDGQREPALGRRAHRQRAAAQVGHPGLATDGEQVPAEAIARPAAWRPTPVDIPEESRDDGHSRLRLLRGGHRYVQGALRLRRHRARHPPSGAYERDLAPECELDATAAQRGHRRYRQPQVADPRSGRYLCQAPG